MQIFLNLLTNVMQGMQTSKTPKPTVSDNRLGGTGRASSTVLDNTLGYDRDLRPAHRRGAKVLRSDWDVTPLQYVRRVSHNSERSVISTGTVDGGRETQTNITIFVSSYTHD